MQDLQFQASKTSVTKHNQKIKMKKILTPQVMRIMQTKQSLKGNTNQPETEDETDQTPDETETEDKTEGETEEIDTEEELTDEIEAVDPTDTSDKIVEDSDGNIIKESYIIPMAYHQGNKI